MKTISAGVMDPVMALQGREEVEEEYFFEGTEKLLEIWFAASPCVVGRGRGSSGHGDVVPDLRRIERPEWERLLEHVRCEIISQKTNASITAYVLSESSLFVSKNRLIIKTCGKTTLLGIIKPLLKLVRDKCGFDIIIDVFYSHKNYLRPDLQPLSHRKFDDEVNILNEIFEDGAAYALGRINRDCWYLYTLDLVGVTQPDQTLEVMMTELNKDVMGMFYQSYGLNADQLTKKTGIADLLPGAILDPFLFDPCGYSVNGILPNGCYFTIHITPEDDFSYVSFETNVPQESYSELIASILDIFKPGKVLVTLLANEASIVSEQPLCGGRVRGGAPPLQGTSGSAQFDNYRRVDQQLCAMKNYSLTYTQYQRCGTKTQRLVEPGGAGLPPPQ